MTEQSKIKPWSTGWGPPFLTRERMVFFSDAIDLLGRRTAVSGSKAGNKMFSDLTKHKMWPKCTLCPIMITLCWRKHRKVVLQYYHPIINRFPRSYGLSLRMEAKNKPSDMGGPMLIVHCLIRTAGKMQWSLKSMTRDTIIQRHTCPLSKAMKTYYYWSLFQVNVKQSRVLW